MSQSTREAHLSEIENDHGQRRSGLRSHEVGEGLIARRIEQ